jgi:hypothetical protein
MDPELTKLIQEALTGGAALAGLVLILSELAR